MEMKFNKSLPISTILLLQLAISAPGCSTSSKKSFNHRSYSLNTPIKIRSGTLVASELHGEVETTRHWVGILNSKDGWSDGRLKFSDEYEERKLFFLGFSEPFLYLMHRVYLQGMPKASVEEVERYDLNQTPFIHCGAFNLELEDLQSDLSAGSWVATFRLYDQPSFKDRQQAFLQLKEKRDDEEQLRKIQLELDLARTAADDAQEFAERFGNFTSRLSSFPAEVEELGSLNAALDVTRSSRQSTRELTDTFQNLKVRYVRASRYLLGLKEALEAWSKLDEDFKEATREGIAKQYLAIALDLKLRGEQALQGENFKLATENFSEAREEVSHAKEYTQRGSVPIPVR